MQVISLKKVTYVISLLIVFFLPFPKKIIPPLIILLFISWLFESPIRNKFSNIKFKSVFFLSIIFYTIHIIGLLYTENIKAGLFDLEVKLTLFLFPLFFVSVSNIFREKFNYILLSFLTGNLLAAIICFIIAFYNAFNYLFYCSLSTGFSIGIKPISELYYHNFYYGMLSKFMHPTYFSMYLIFCICIIFYFFNNKIYCKTLLKKLILISLVLFFLITIYFLSSRAGQLTCIVVFTINIFLLKFTFIKNKLLKYAFLSFLSIFVIIASLSNDRFLNAVKQSYLLFFPKDLNSQKLSNDRIILWQVSYELAKENIIFGVGTGDIKNELKKKYNKYNITDAINSEYNSHNQYLETFIGQGIIGFITLLILLGFPFIYGIRKKNYLLVSFIIIISINFLFESALNNQAGVVFFSFFYCFCSTLNFSNKI